MKNVLGAGWENNAEGLEVCRMAAFLEETSSIGVTPSKGASSLGIFFFNYVTYSYLVFKTRKDQSLSIMTRSQ